MPSNNAPSAPENPAIPKAQENPWYIQHFTKLLIGFGLGGGAVAILLPWMLWLLCGMSSGSSDQLRLHLLYVTGGIIAVLTLLQTNWKNQGDRLKIDADIKKNEQDAKSEAAKREQDAVKSERDHTRQVHAERRSRYTKAVEQLADEKATVRLGGIYTLVGLVDEWLADDALNPEERQKEGQVIINNLCSYIRSPFPLAEKVEEYEARNELEELKKKESKSLSPLDSLRLMILNKRFTETNDEKKIEQITVGYAKIQEEQDVRRTIFAEMSKRSSTFVKDKIGKVIGTFSGMWSGFDFDFSRAPIFYPLNAITIEKGNFSSAKFYGNADFRGGNLHPKRELQRSNLCPNRELQQGNLHPIRKLQLGNLRSNRELQRSNLRSNRELQQGNLHPIRGLQRSNLHPNRKLQQSSLHPIRKLQLGNLHPNRRLQQGNLHPNRRLQQGSLYPNRKLQRSSLHPNRELQQRNL